MYLSCVCGLIPTHNRYKIKNGNMANQFLNSNEETAFCETMNSQCHPAYILSPLNWQQTLHLHIVCLMHMAH